VSAHGFTADQLAQMVRVGFAAKTSEPVVGSVGKTSKSKGSRLPGPASAGLSTVSGFPRLSATCRDSMVLETNK
jgi:hypothetical protein